MWCLRMIPRYSSNPPTLSLMENKMEVRTVPCNRIKVKNISTYVPLRGTITRNNIENEWRDEESDHSATDEIRSANIHSAHFLQATLGVKGYGRGFSGHDEWTLQETVGKTKCVESGSKKQQGQGGRNHGKLWRRGAACDGTSKRGAIAPKISAQTQKGNFYREFFRPRGTRPGFSRWKGSDRFQFFCSRAFSGACNICHAFLMLVYAKIILKKF